MLKQIEKIITFPFLLLLVCIFAYLPLSSFLFALKNDAFIYNFPNKFFFSECLKEGHLPVWNPYLNFGFPIYADPGFAWWHPITWIFGFIGYNAFTFSVEVLLYIYIAGLGMYWLGKRLNFHNYTAFSIGCMFMCCGFFIGNLQHINFITCGAFIPWLTGCWLLYQQAPTLKNLFYCGIAAYLLFTAGHPAIPIAMIYYLTLIIILYYILNRKKLNVWVYGLHQIMFLLISIIILLPLIFSYLEVLPLYTRAEPSNQLESTDVGFTLPSFKSFIFPFSTIKNQEWFGTDVSMRNAYFSLAGFIALLTFIFQPVKKRLQYVFLSAGLLMLFLSAGGNTKIFVYENLPGLQFIRTNGEFRVFSIFSFIVCGAFALEQIYLKDYLVSNSFKTIFKWTALLSFMTTPFLAFTLAEESAWTFNQTGFTNQLKYIVDHITFKQSFLISLSTTAFLSLIYFFSLKKTKPTFFLLVLLLDIIVNSWLLLGITGVGKTSVSEMQTVIDKNPEGFPAPSLNNNKDIPPLSNEEVKLIGNWSWYDKQIVHSPIDYPSQLKSLQTALESNDASMLLAKPFVFLKNDSANVVSVLSFAPSAVKVKIRPFQADTLVLLQNAYPGWKVYVNNKAQTLLPYSSSFMALPVLKGEQVVEWKFETRIFKIILIWTLLLGLALVIAFFKRPIVLSK